MSLLSVEHVSFSYSGSAEKPVADISFSVEKGEYVAIVGSNGSGKSTLARIICGFLEPGAGRVIVEGGMPSRHQKSADNTAPTGIVFQYPKDQIVSGIISRDTAFGPENLNCTKDEIEQRTIESLSVTGLLERAMDGTSELSLGQTQKLALSGILALRPDLLVLDEVTSMLDPESRVDILDFLDACHKRNQTILHITHDEVEVRRANRVIAMEKGAVIFDGSREEFFADKELVDRLFGEDLPPSKREEKLRSREVVFRASDVCFTYNDRTVLNDFSMELRSGTITALTGASGSGKSTFLELSAGLLLPDSGTIEGVCRPVLGLQDAQAALFEQFAADDVAFAPRNRGVKGKELKQRVRSAMEMAGLPFSEFADRLTYMLSGGEKRKLSLAGIIAMDSPVLFFDEPTAALDPESRRSVLRMFRALADSGKTILFSTHRMEEAAFADFHYDLKDGTGREITKEPRPSAEEALAAADSSQKESSVLAASLHSLSALEGVKMLASLKNKSSITAAWDSIPESPVKKLPAPVKYLVFLALFIASIFAGHLCTIAVLAGLSLLYALFSRCPFSKIARTFIAVLPWIGIFCLLQLVLIPPAEGEQLFTSWKWFSLSPSKLILCAQTIVRTFAAFTVIRVFVFSIDEKQLLEGFSALLTPLRLLRIPVRSMIVVVEIIFRFIPLLVEEAESIIKTQLVRGGLGSAKGVIARVKILFPLFVPLILQTLKRSEILADALTARYF